jgi:hypothetical protein
MGHDLTVMKTYTVDGVNRRILYIHKKELQYDNGNYNDIPKLSSVYSFIQWLLSNGFKL